MTGETKRVSIDTIRVVAEVVGDDPEAVLTLAAGYLLDSPANDGDPRLDGLDPNDPVVQHIMSLPVDEQMRTHMLNKQRQMTELRRRQDIEELELMWRREAPQREHDTDPTSRP